MLCEKPLRHTVADAEVMLAACHQAGVRLGTGFHLRHHPFHIEARRLVSDRSLGQVLTAEAEWSLTPRPDSGSAEWRWDPEASGGGIFTGTGVHAVDLLRFVLSDEVENVRAIADRAPASGEVDQVGDVPVELQRRLSGCGPLRPGNQVSRKRTASTGTRCECTGAPQSGGAGTRDD